MKYLEQFKWIWHIAGSVFFSLLVMVSCQHFQNKREAIISDMLGKQLEFPDTLKRLSSKNDEISTKAFELNRAAVFTYIFGDCSSCIGKIKQWNEFFHHEAFTNLRPVIVVYTHDLTGFLWNYRPLKEINQYPIYLDTEKQIQQINDLPDSWGVKNFYLKIKNLRSIL